MRRLIFVVAGLVVLAMAGLAVANGLDSAKSVKLVAGTFTATTASVNSKTQTCKTTDNKTIVVTKGKYSGTAAGDLDLAGPVTLDARSVINTTDDIGLVEGKLRIDVASGGDTVAQFSAVYDHGKLAGLATGHVQDPHAKLLANLSAGFSASGGFSDGKLGNTAGGSAVEVGSGKCEPAHAKAGEKSEAKGEISALSTGSPGSITVGALTCVIPANLAVKASKFKLHDEVEISCTLVNGQNTLAKIKKEH